MLWWSHSSAQQSCGGSCSTLDDCAGQIICINGQCNEDPQVGTHICSGGGESCPATSGNSDSCFSSNGCQTSSCSPHVTSTTPAILTLNNFSQCGDLGGPSECDGHYQDNSERVVALSTGWYNGGSHCGDTTAQVVDECDIQNGCDVERAGQPSCADNIVDGSMAVLQDLGRQITEVVGVRVVFV
ncbi:hypothetical protein KP509_09G061900 [Ceratopteris richardii]|uniref:Uncharacterized protein n=1 Tax=Ceratopteris richardii TaxID=49495 RepID=A0A8T2U7X8_CERRI|nr:hypothetical protein KP509_09G061900 [Ceratopteris richardii]